MPAFTVELKYDVPYYARVQVEAATFEEAKRLAFDADVNFDPCYDACTDTEIAGAWAGDVAYRGLNLVTGETDRF